MVMSAIALRPTDVAIASRESTPRPSFLQRLIKAREAEARRHVQGYLAAQSDARLEDLGFTPGEIETMRQGRFAFSNR
jgi:hypothetical protein